MSGDISGYPNWEGAAGIQWAEIKDATKHSIMHKTALTTKTKKCQYLPRLKNLFQTVLIDNRHEDL